MISYDSSFEVANLNLQEKLNWFCDEYRCLNLSLNKEKVNSIQLAKEGRKQISVKIDGDVVKQLNQLKFLGRTTMASLSLK